MNTTEFRAFIDKQATKTIREDSLFAIADEYAEKLKQVEIEAARIGIHATEIQSVRNRLYAEAETRWMRNRYPVLDLSFAEATKKIAVGRDPAKLDEIIIKETEGEHDQAISVPVFAQTWSDLSDLWDQEDVPTVNSDSVSFGSLRKKGLSYPARSVRLVASLPSGFSNEHRRQAVRCAAFIRMFDAVLLDRGCAELRRHHYWNRGSDINVGMLWAPNEWHVRTAPIPKVDPAILVRREDGPVYLVGYYDTPDERNIENLIREFSEGKVGKVLKGKKK